MKNFLKNRKLLAIIGVVVIIGVAAFIFWPKQTTSQTLRQTTTVSKNTIIQKVETTGQVSSQNLQNAGFRSAGTISVVYVKVGEVVKKGQALAAIDKTALTNTLAKSQASLQTAKNNLQNTYLKGKYTDYDIANLKQQITSAQAQVTTDEQNLNNATLTAEINGTVVRINSKPGDNASASGSNSQETSSAQQGAVLIVVDFNALTVNLSVTDADISKLQKDQPAEITFDSIKDKTYTGKIVNVDLLGTSNSGVVSYNVTLKFDKPDAAIRIGMSANASVIVNTKRDVLTVPTTYIKTVNGEKTVTIVQDGKDSQVIVQTGISDDTNTEIISGLSEGQEIVRITSAASTSARTTTPNLLGVGGGTGGQRQFITR